MTKISNIIDSILNEGRDAHLYHATQIYFFPGFIRRNKILGRTDQIFTRNGKDLTKKGVSLTRDYKFAENWRDDSDHGYSMIFVLDQRKLSQKYKIVPYDWFNSSKSDPKRNFPFESEEFLEGDIKNLNRYLISINIKKVRIKEFKDTLRWPTKEFSLFLQNNLKLFNKIIPNNFKSKYHTNQEIVEEINANIS